MQWDNSNQKKTLLFFISVAKTIFKKFEHDCVYTNFEEFL